MVLSWHQNFNPRQFLAKIDVEKLITRNKAYPENEVVSLLSPCILCGENLGAGIVLNDKRFVCKACFQIVSLIEYPERYETLRRDYLIKREARRAARSALIDGSFTRKAGSFFAVVGGITIPLIFWKLLLLVVPVICFGISKLAGQAHAEKLTRWDMEFPEPSAPELRHFHDPRAELTLRDQLVLDVFNNWPGYPPFWRYLREIVLKRDGHRCQVTGCPSRLELHIHHRMPVSKGGAHSPENLISLCDFHHALEPDAGHERIWANIKTRYFTLVHSHTRSNRAAPGTHDVSAHLRRLELVTAAELVSLSKIYGLSCPHCNFDQIRIKVHEKQNIVEVECLHCRNASEGPQELTEETGPRLAELLKPTLCVGTWKARWDMLSERKKTGWSDWKKSSDPARRREYKKKRTDDSTKPSCPMCGSPMRLIRPRPGDHWKPFWGCTQFRITKCKGSASYSIQ